ncbi:alkaline phosphatase PhoX [Actinomadura fibrosa]|uniref:Alkaline phosphatase PhoX n=1 Tax=Actinomadura fibrosa TaxID=111802 RepID=A0ABW2X9P7_9ACTN|nr:alkaline phosphatase PhoX [Actinomadura fibrosa]
MSVTRRGVVKGGAAGALSIALAGSLDSIFQTSAGADVGEAYGYGPLVPDPKGVLDLPKGFSYKQLSVEGDPIKEGVVVPGHHDGTATFPGSRPTRTRLVRNHEQSNNGTRAVAPASLTYDPAANGGTTTLEVDRDGDLISQYVSLAGTSTNCAGGRTPWGTWLTCEETEGFTGQTKSHGWVFEVDPHGKRTKPVPLTALGRFAHEAVAVDPHTLTAYLTEDASKPFGLFYRFRPRAHRGDYHAYAQGGTLEALHIPDVPDLSLVQEPGTKLRARWVPVPDPSAAATSTRKQLDTITRSQKLEGAWWAHGKAYFVCSYSKKADGAAADHAGQVWTYDPHSGKVELQLVFKPGGVFDGPDNITVSPYGGGVILAEDGDGEQHLIGTTKKNKPFAIARNALNGSEFTGVTFSPDGRILFANRQEGPGVTFAITGPWHRLRG